MQPSFEAGVVLFEMVRRMLACHRMRSLNYRQISFCKLTSKDVILWVNQGSRCQSPDFGDRRSYDIAMVLSNERGAGGGPRLLSPLLPAGAVDVIAGLLERDPAKRLGLEEAIARVERAVVG